MILNPYAIVIDAYATLAGQTFTLTTSTDAAFQNFLTTVTAQPVLI